MLNSQLHLRLARPKKYQGFCFQVLGSYSVFGVLGVFVFKTPIESCNLRAIFFDFQVE